MATTKFIQSKTDNDYKTPVQLIDFKDVENELFGVQGTPERDEYEARIALELLPKTIREYRLRHKLTQNELGERIGVQKAQISKLERNSSNVTLGTLRRVFKALNTDIQFILRPIMPQA